MDEIRDYPISERDLTHKRRPSLPMQTGEKVLLALLVIVMILSTLTCVGLLFHRFYYETFWVNGQSMYPTLNHEVRRKDGTYVEDQHYVDSICDMSGYDYGIMDKHDAAVRNIKRFDIIILKYHEEGESQNIKRVIGLPGDKLYFAAGDPATNGDLYVCPKGKSSFQKIEQPLPEEVIRSGAYPTYNSEASAIMLQPDQIFVVGDNRPLGHSSDSRAEGPFSTSLIIGKAVAIEGTCSIKADDSGNYQPVDIQYHLPIWL